MKKRNEEDWTRLFDACICSFISGLAGNYAQMSYTQCVDEAIYGAEYLVEELKKLEERETKQTTSEK